jgi:hypothetical protein
MERRIGNPTRGVVTINFPAKRFYSLNRLLQCLLVSCVAIARRHPQWRPRTAGHRQRQYCLLQIRPMIFGKPVREGDDLRGVGLIGRLFFCLEVWGTTQSRCRTLRQRTIEISPFIKKKSDGATKNLSLARLILSLRFALTPQRWEQFWSKINQYGLPMTV